MPLQHAATSLLQLSDALHQSAGEQLHRPPDFLSSRRDVSVDAIMRGRRMILFAGFVACMEDTRLPSCVMFGGLMGGAGCVGGQEK